MEIFGCAIVGSISRLIAATFARPLAVFDGLEDNRYVRGRTRDEVIEEIENWIEENE